MNWQTQYAGKTRKQGHWILCKDGCNTAPLKTGGFHAG